MTDEQRRGELLHDTLHFCVSVSQIRQLSKKSCSEKLRLIEEEALLLREKIDKYARQASSVSFG